MIGAAWRFLVWACGLYCAIALLILTECQEK